MVIKTIIAGTAAYFAYTKLLNPTAGASTAKGANRSNSAAMGRQLGQIAGQNINLTRLETFQSIGQFRP